MTWVKGKAEVDRLLEAGEIERVPASEQLAERLLSEATRHLSSARSIQTSDPTGSYQLAYDAARKAASALLAVQGLRATSRGGHIALQDVVRAQFGPVFERFSRLRRGRQTSEYPDLDSPAVTADDAAYAIVAADKMLDAARKLHETGQVGPY